jgi:hypothetical protein
MNDSLKEIEDIKIKCIDALKIFDDANTIRIFNALDNSINKVAQSWSKSWIGYQACVYYADFSIPQSGDNFSIEFGFNSILNSPVSENWRQYNYEQVLHSILHKANVSQEEVDLIENSLTSSKKTFQESRNEFITIIEILNSQNKDNFLEKIFDEATNIKTIFQSDIINEIRPSQTITSDLEAQLQGLKSPPHILFQTFLLSLKSIKIALEKLINCQKKAEKY